MFPDQLQKSILNEYIKLLPDLQLIFGGHKIRRKIERKD
jgi:putative cell wall-binding protein